MTELAAYHPGHLRTIAPSEPGKSFAAYACKKTTYIQITQKGILSEYMFN